MRTGIALILICVGSAPALAGLHYSREEFRELPAKWPGFLADHRSLRTIATPSGPLRDQYADAALKLEATSRNRELSADEAADLGAVYVRLGKSAQALGTLRTAARRHPDHFRLAANLGTAWQVAGDPTQAAAALEDAVRLAPQKWRACEQHHLTLVRLRSRGGTPSAPDDLFSGTPLTPLERLVVVQQLALWLPADGQLLWMLGELARETGDIRTAANILDGCVTEFGMTVPELRAHRRTYRLEVDAAEAKGHRPATPSITFKSSRALLRGVDPSRLPAIDPDGVNGLPWVAVGETELGPNGIPSYLRYVDQLDGRKVRITGFMAPVGGTTAGLTGFLLTENPIGCWFCESPGPTQVFSVELADGVTTELTRTVVKVTGTLRLNRTDPERFPLTLDGARVGPAD